MDEEIAKHVKTALPLIVTILIVAFLAIFRLILPLVILLVLVCVLLVVAVLIQAHRGGGLVGSFGGIGIESTLGSSGTPVKKFTAGLAILLLIIVLALNKAQQYTSVVEEQPAVREVEPRQQKAPSEAPAPPAADQKPDSEKKETAKDEKPKEQSQ